MLAAQEQEVMRPLNTGELRRLQEGKVSRETIAEERFWSKRPDGIALKKPTETKKVVSGRGECVRMKL